VQVARECGERADASEVAWTSALRVEGRRQRKERARDRRRQVQEPQVRALAERDAERATAFVARVRAQTGEGPTWREVGSAMGWPQESWSIETGVARLIDLGFVTATSDYRSLDVVRH
jgi:hypothetical protein